MAAHGESVFGDLLRERRAAEGLTQEALAEQAGISARAITDLERGVIRAPRRDTLQLIAQALRLSPDELQQWDELRRRLSRRQSRSSQTGSDVPTLPQPSNSLIGRGRDITALVNLLMQRDTRLVTVTGPGGVGKTRVALAVGHELAHTFADGIRFVELAAVRDPALLPLVIAQEFGLREGEERTIRERIKLYLARREMLLILDNMEQLLPAAPDIARLLSNSSSLKVLVTSRAGLGLHAEHVFPLSPLPLPDWDGSRDGKQLEAYPAIELFVQRSRQVQPTFSLTEANAPAVTAICAHLDGLPLAIELAAARVKVISPQEMLARLTDRLHFLTGGRQDAPDRHQTMRAAIGWSYDLLSPVDQYFFRKLAVFSGGWTLEAAEAVAPADIDVLDGLAALLNNNLIHQTRQAGERTRYAMLEMVREFGLSQLDELGERHEACRHHGRYFLELAETAEPELRGPKQGEWLTLLADELGNLRSALDWSSDPGIEPEFALRLAGALSPFWWSRGHITEGYTWLTQALQRESTDAATRMRALAGAGWLAHVQHHSITARQLLHECLRLAHETGDRWAVGWTLHLLGRVAYIKGEAESARSFGYQSLEVAREIDDAWVGAWALHLIALSSHIEGDFDTARDFYEKALRIRREIEYPEGIGTVNGLLGMITLSERDYEKALELLRQSLIMHRELGARWLVINMVANVVLIAAVYGEPDRAARLAGFVEVMSEYVGAGPIPIADDAFQEGIARAREQLGHEVYTQAWNDGRSMSLDEAIDLAISIENVAAMSPEV